MYFSNISDSELTQYHNEVKNNFTILLTEALTSNLFKIETIINNSIYKIYPLFYCENIESTNPNDKILDNKCIICEKNTQTLLKFKTSKTISSNVDLKYQFDKNYGLTLHCWDDNNMLPVPNVKVTGKISMTGSPNTLNFDGFTDENGTFNAIGDTYVRISSSWVVDATLEFNGEHIYINE